MAATDGVSNLGPEAATACVPLSDEADWNQAAEDWAMMLTHGHAPYVAGTGERPAATSLALPMGDRIGWISMVLVTQRLRRQGIAKRLVGDCIDWLEARGLAPHLDATPAGQPLYRSMMFEPHSALTRWAGQTGRAAGDTLGDGIRVAGAADLDWIERLDREVFGGQRAFVLSDLLARPCAVSLVCEDRRGFLLSRAGRKATQIGPVIAPDGETALALISAALSRIDGPVMLDAFDDDDAVAGYLADRGFATQRPFLRMARGLSCTLGDPARYFVAAGPELG